VRVKAEKKFGCFMPNCSQSFTSEKALQQHVEQELYWKAEEDRRRESARQRVSGIK
jgi:hypothetical protein